EPHRLSHLAPVHRPDRRGARATPAPRSRSHVDPADDRHRHRRLVHRRSSLPRDQRRQGAGRRHRRRGPRDRRARLPRPPLARGQARPRRPWRGAGV
ncbi:MAG: hypothetical protein AVDCRST_MAG85-650, partial [uncultured Solirubrobacteraceae bacterium]